jgi:hypothetical protein
MKTGNNKSARKRPLSRRLKAKRESAPGAEEIYCTECGATLENFCFSTGAEDLGAIRRTLAQCRKQGKFSGDFCSKLFIAHPDALPVLSERSDDDPEA